MANAETVEDLSKKLIDGVRDTFDSDNFQKYLKYAASFHSYSLRNTILIMMQRPESTDVKGFQAWKKFGRYVKRNEKGIAIFAPSKIKVKKDRSVLDENGNEQLHEDGSPIMQEVEETVIKFVVTYIFDVLQTDGEPLPEICKELQGSVDNFEKVFESVKALSPYKVEFEHITDGSKGYCDHKNSRIAINMGMSEEQIVKTLIHEYAHAILHRQTDKTRERKEVEAESVAFIVSEYLGVDTSSYSFGYVAEWSKGMELQELQNVLESIQSTANQIINSLQEEFQTLEKSKTEPEHEISNLQERLSQAAEKSAEMNQEQEIKKLEKRIS